MASNESAGQDNSELRTIIQKYDPFLGAFQTFNTLLLEKFREFDGHLQEWNHQQKFLNDPEIECLFLHLKNITAIHDLSKSVNGTMKALYDTISTAL